MNPLIALSAGDFPSIAERFQQGQQLGQQNALRAALQQYGSAAVRGDQNALAAIAQFDPQAALELMSGRQQMDLRNRADDRAERGFGLEQQRHDQSIAAGNQSMEIARQKAREATEAHKVDMTAAQREQAMQEIQLIGAFENVGSEQDWDTLADRLKLPELRGQFGQKDALIGMAQGVSEALAGPVEPVQLGADERLVNPRSGQEIVGTAPGGGGTDDIKEWQFAVQNGYTGSFADWQTKNREISVGTPPPGFALEYDPSGRPTSMSPIPGSPAAREAELAQTQADNRSGQRDLAGDVVLNAAENARDIASSGSILSPRTGVTGSLAAGLSSSQAAELRRQTEVLKATASIETLQQMRNNSPTGGALGQVTEGEHRLLSAKAGALDPNASGADYQAQLEDYTRTLLKVIHGPEEGERIYQESRRGGGAGGAGGATSSGVQWRLID